eukprot:4332274-Pleurochrysis_carterae.AAC.1
MANVNACSVITGAVLLLPAESPQTAPRGVRSSTWPVPFAANEGYPDSEDGWRPPHGELMSLADAVPL